MSQIIDYSGKRVVVTGCHSGIGHATARLLIEAGAHVFGLDWQPCDLKLAGFFQTDLRSCEEIDTAVGQLGGRVDALFNCAGVAPGRPILDIMRVNFIGTRYLTEGLVDLMSAGSAIVNVSSVGGAGWSKRVPTILDLLATKDFEAASKWCEENAELIVEGYSFSKEALIVWTMIQSGVWATRGIRTNATLPGAVNTPLLEEIERTTKAEVVDAVTVPIGRRSTSTEQAQVLLMLNSDAASYINGAILPVEGGFLTHTAIKAMTT